MYVTTFTAMFGVTTEIPLDLITPVVDVITGVSEQGDPPPIIRQRISQPHPKLTHVFMQ